MIFDFSVLMKSI